MTAPASPAPRLRLGVCSHLLLVLLGTPLALGSAACGGDADPPHPGVDSGASDTDAAVEPPDAGGTPTGDEPGFILFRGGAYGGAEPYAFYEAYAQFLEVPPSTCNRSPMGSCQAIRCTNGGSDPETTPHAGPITFAGGPPTFTLAPETNGYYNSVAGEVAAFTGGETLTVSASGGQGVPAFSASLVAPQHPSLSAPVLGPPSDATVFDMEQDLVVTWTGGDVGNVSPSFLTFDSETGDTLLVTCTVPASTGTVTMPKVLLDTLTEPEGIFSVEVAVATRVVAGSWPTRIEVSGSLKGPQGDETAVSATFQRSAVARAATPAHRHQQMRAELARVRRQIAR